MRKKKRWALIMAIVMLVLSVPNSMIQAQEIQSTQEFAIECAVESESNPLYGFNSETSTAVTFESAQQTSAPEISGPRLENFDLGIAYLRNAFVNRETHIEFGFYCDQPIDKAGEVIKEALFTHTKNPIEGDYLRFQYREYSVTRYLVTSGSRYCYLIFMDVVYMTDSAQEAAVSAAVSSLLGSLGVNSMDSYSKIKTIYNWICQNVSYDYAHVGNTEYLKQFSAYGALVERTAVCQGYAVLLYRLLLESGVDVRVIPGTGNSTLHAWNIVELNGVYYNVDSTWDAGKDSYGYFLCSEADFSGHIRLDDYRTNAFMTSYPMSSKTYESEETTTQETTIPETTAPETTTQETTAPETTAEETSPETESSTQETTPEGDSSVEQTTSEQETTSQKKYPDGLALDKNRVWKYYKNGEVCTSYTGLTLYYGTWYYVEKGVLNWNYTGLTKYYGTWYYVKGGRLDWGYTGLTKYYGTWYYVEKGILNWNYTGLTKYYGTWYYVKGGRLDWTYIGLTKYYGTWYYVDNGVLNWNYTGLTQYYGTWYYVKGGRLDWNYTDLILYYGTWYHIKGGRWNCNYTGLVQHCKTWYYVSGGCLDWNYTGLTKYYGTWYYVEKGVLNWNYTGLTKYYGTWYYVQKGILNWKYNGIVYHNGVRYTVTNGVAKCM